MGKIDPSESRIPHLLIVDDEPGGQLLMRQPIEGLYHIHTVSNGLEAVQFLEKNEVDLVLLDITMPVMDGFAALPKIKALDPTIEVIIVSIDASEETGLRAREMGAFSYVTKASIRVDAVQYLNAIERALEKREMSQELEARRSLGSEALDRIIGESKEIHKIKAEIPKYAASEMSVIIQGPTGVGKELIARAIHETGPRAGHPFIAVNCSTVPESLFESEMFGHEKGSFTSAADRHKGKFELANRGTLFLDEIGTLPREHQAKLLRAVEEKVIQRVGGEKDIPLDIRIIVATDTNLKEAVESGQFRSPLFHRLNGIPIHIPPLRERPTDVKALLYHFLYLFNRKYGKHKQLAPDLETFCLGYRWEGNVREMKALMERGVSLYPGELVLTEHLFPELVDGRRGALLRDGTQLGEPLLDLEQAVAAAFENQPPQALRATVEKMVIHETLKRAAWMQSEAAKALDMDPKTLRTKIQKYGLREGEAS